MLRIEKVISRSGAGPELAALAVARLCGVATGGGTRIFRGRKSAGVVRVYGLSADPCSRRQALLNNIRRAEGTLIFGRFGGALEGVLLSERCHYCCIERPRENAGARVVLWMQRHGIRTLNFVGRTDRDSTFSARAVLLEVFRELGHRPILPAGAAGPASPNTRVVAGNDACHAVVPWPVQGAWRWHETRGEWAAVADWTTLDVMNRPDWATRHLWEAVPAHVRQWVTREYAASGPFEQDEVVFDLDLLEVLGRLGRAAEDCAAAGRWAVLRLLSCARTLLPADRADWPALAELLAGRQRDLLGCFGFPATESAARVLAKVPRGSCDLDVLLRLRQLLWDEGSRTPLRRLPRLNATAIDVLSDPWLRRVVGWRLLWRLATGPREGCSDSAPVEAGMLLHWLKAEAERTGRRGRVGVFDSVGAVSRAIEDLRDLPSAGWPSAPKTLPRIDGGIERLGDTVALMAEGREMRHCAARYWHDVRRGRCLMFRVLPDPGCGTGRATLDLRPGADGVWRVEQLYGAANAPAEPGTRRFVETWLFFAHCDHAVASDELRRSCLAELAGAGAPPKGRAA